MAREGEDRISLHPQRLVPIAVVAKTLALSVIPAEGRYLPRKSGHAFARKQILGLHPTADSL
jgi:hypothetical protein